MADAKSTRTSVRARSRRQTRRSAHRPGSRKPGLQQLLGRLSDAISLIATVSKAFAGAQLSEGKLSAADMGDELATLQKGAQCLRSAYDDVEDAIRGRLS